MSLVRVAEFRDKNILTLKGTKAMTIKLVNHTLHEQPYETGPLKDL